MPRPPHMFNIGDIVTPLSYDELDKEVEYYDDDDGTFFALTKDDIDAQTFPQTIRSVCYDEYRGEWYYGLDRWSFYESMLVESRGTNDEQISDDLCEITSMFDMFEGKE